MVKRILSLAALALLVAGTAIGQTVSQDGGKMRTYNAQPLMLMNRADSTGSLLTSDGTGAAKVTIQGMDRNANRVIRDIIANTGLGTGTDSSIVEDTHDLQHMTLWIKATPAAGTGNVLRLAVQIREHLDGLTDSLNTFVWYPQGISPLLGNGVIAAASDSLVFGHLLTGSATAPWSGEFVVVVNGNRSAPADGVAATVFSYPNGIAIPLDNLYGRNAMAPNLSVRVRVIAGNCAKLNMHLAGTPL